jgi:Fic family protein
MSYLEKRNEVDLLHQKINSFGELSLEVKKKINYKFRLDWNYYSNSMEGNTLTMDETRSVMVGNLTVGGKPIKDVLEMKGHDEVIANILKIGKGEIRISEAKIREIHKGIMHEEDEAKKKKIGVWKTEPNYIYNYKNERFNFTPPEEVPLRMHEVLNKTNDSIDSIHQNKKKSSHPLDIALQFHLDYVIIHPFYDGNGRTARILTNLLLISFGYPPFWIKENERATYNQYIGDIQGYGGKPDLFYEYVAGLILRSQQLVLDALDGKEIEEEDDFLKEIQLIKSKTENTELPKSPKLIFTVFDTIRKETWPKLIETLNHFDELFTDSKTFHFVNDLDEEFPTKKLFQYDSVSTEPKKIEIFGHDVYDREIRKIEWHHTKFGLKGSNNGDKIEINFSISFNLKAYRLKLSVNSNALHEAEKKYGDLLLKDETSKMVKALKDYLLLEIKKKTEIDK